MALGGHGPLSKRSAEPLRCVLLSLGGSMRRREFIAGLGGVAIAWPHALGAQQAMPLIGFLSSRSPAESAGLVAAFRLGLRETGFVEARNLAIAFRWAEGRYD